MQKSKGLSKKATCLRGGMAVWPKLITADVYQCLRRLLQPQVFPCKLATISNIINIIIFSIFHNTYKKVK